MECLEAETNRSGGLLIWTSALSVSLISKACFPASPPSFSPLPTNAFSTVTAKRKGMAKELEARTESNGYRRPTERQIALGLQARKLF